METFISFAKENLLLVIAFTVILLLLLQNELRNLRFGLKSISPQMLTFKLNRENAVILDIREKSAFDSGHIIRAQNIPSAELKNSQKKIQKHKNNQIILVCQAGQTCQKTGSYLQQHGFSNIAYLQGGMAAWIEAGMPLEK